MWDEPVGAEEQETLRRLEERLEQASGAAERLIAEAAAAIGTRYGATPPGATTEAEHDPAEAEEPAGREQHGRPDDLELLAQFARRLGDVIPPELQRRLAAAFRELLVALRALVDWCLERLERRRAAPVEVRDIPIDP